jgi:type IV secretion system protein VirB9
VKRIGAAAASAMKRLAAILVLSLTTPALGQVAPQAAGGDPHLQQIDYDSGRIVQLRGSPGFEMMVELSPDEQVQNVAVGDGAAWQVSVNKGGDRLFIKPIQPDVETNMTVVTSVRIYSFDLMSMDGPTADMPYTVQFRYPPPRVAPSDGQYVDVSAATRRMSRYKVSGDRLLWPSSVTNDGQHTYITWPRTSPIPAVYAYDQSGNEVLVNGMMGTDDVYVIDGAPQTLMFRIDRDVAYAVRINLKRKR